MIKVRSTPAILRAVLMAACAVSAVTSAHAAEKVIRIGMTASDLPKTHGQPDQAFEGVRVTGLTMYDALTQWDYVTGTRIAPALATDWRVSPDDKTKWIFALRPGVKFGDGSPFNADAVVWNVQKVLDKGAPQFDPTQVGFTVSRMPTLRSARKIDDLTVEMVTAEPDSFLPINLVNLFFASPTHWASKLAAVAPSVNDPAARSAQAWAAFAMDPSGTGRFTLASFRARERLEMVRKPDYWDAPNAAKIDRIVLMPLPEATSRTAALLSGQVDWIEAPAPDAVESIRGRGFKITTSKMSTVWPWQPSLLEGSPWRDKRVRQAANLCVDRGDLIAINGGLADAAAGMLRADHPWFGNPTFKLRFAPEDGVKLMKDAGYNETKRAQVKVLMAQSGSGQMQAVQMNELIQGSLRNCFIDVTLETVDWGVLFTNWREGPRVPSARGANATNVSVATMDPFFALARFADSRMVPPLSNNWGFINDPELDRLTAIARTTFDAKDRDKALGAIHERLVNEAMFVWFVHDVAPRAMSARITGYSAPNGYYVDWGRLDMTAQ